MAISAAKLEANRRNAQKSTGPRTEEGKKNSSLNATKHGMRAETLVLPGEDPQELEERRAGWRACLLPGDDVEHRLVNEAVEHTWLQDRARRAQAGRINANIANFGVDEGQTIKKEVEELGTRLFKERCGPLMLYPSPTISERYDFSRDPSTSFPARGQDDPDRPSAIILCLQSTLQGCEWLLAEWTNLKEILDKGQALLSADKLKAVRLLGRQPFDAIDDRDVAMVFLASYVLKPDHGSWYWEIATELAGKEIKRFRNSVAARELDSLMPQNAAQAREALRELIERATERVLRIAEAHQERARAIAAAAPDFLAFDDSPEGERLRRFDLANGRGLARSLGELRRHRNSGRPLSVVRGPLSVVGDMAVSKDEPNVTNEPTVGPLSVVSGPLPVANDKVVLMVELCATNEPTEACENVTNEPTVGPLPVGSCPLPVGGCAVEDIDEQNSTNEPTGTGRNGTNEPTEAHENATNEPKLAAESGGAHGADRSAGADETGEENFEEGLRVKTFESVRRASAEVGLVRSEFLRKLNEEDRKEAEQAMAVRRARRCEQRKATDKPGDASVKRAARPELRGRMVPVSGNAREPDSL